MTTGLDKYNRVSGCSVFENGGCKFSDIELVLKLERIERSNDELVAACETVLRWNDGEFYLPPEITGMLKRALQKEGATP